MNERLVGVPINDLQFQLQNEVVSLLKEHVENYDNVLRSLSDVLNIPSNEKIYYSGKTNILKQPEFQDVDKVQEILKLMEDDRDFYQMLKNTPFGLHVKIGTENKLPAMDDLSLITATYHIGEDPVGTIAILGPNECAIHELYPC